VPLLNTIMIYFVSPEYTLYVCFSGVI